MQNIIQRIYNETLSEDKKLIASHMDDNGDDYCIFAWNVNNRIIRLGYGVSGKLNPADFGN